MTGQSVDLKAMLTGASGDAAPLDDAREDISEGVNRVPHSSELLSFVDAVLNHGDPAPDIHAARTALRDVLSDAAFVDACATVASFNAVVKVADGTGIPLEPQKAEKTAQLRAELDIDQLRDQGRFNQP